MSRIPALSMALLASGVGGAALAQGCPPADGLAIPVVEQLNQMVLDSDFAGVATVIQQTIGMNIRGGIENIAQTYAAGFDSCTTVLQRADTGGMVQVVVMYESSVGPFFGFYRTVEVAGEARLVSFTLSPKLDEVMEKVK